MYQPTGIIHLTGEHDTGKTLAALGLSHPKKTAFFHSDVKFISDNPDNPQLAPSDFGLWVDVVNETKGMTLFPYREHILNIIEGIQDNQFDSIIFDTWTKFGTSLINYAVNTRQFIKSNETIMSHDPKVVGSQHWKAAYGYEAQVIAGIAKKTKRLILVTHLKDQNIGGVKSGKEIADASKNFDVVCNLRLWLRHNQDSGVPIALVLKRISRIEVTDTGVQPINILPRRIKPLPEERTIWQSIDRYWNNPIGNRIPTQDENPTSFELSILDGILTDDQKDVWKANLRAKELADKEDMELFNNDWSEAKQLAIELAGDNKGMPPPLYVDGIIAKFNESYPQYGRDDIMEMLK